MKEGHISGARLIIVCGLPGSGKTIHATRIQAALHAIRLCPDEWMRDLSIDIWDEEKRARIESLQWQLGQQLLALGLTIIIEWGTWGRSERDALRTRAQELGAIVELHYLSGSIDALFERIQRRGMENPPITPEQLQQWVNSFQEPTAEEQALFDEFVAVEI